MMYCSHHCDRMALCLSGSRAFFVAVVKLMGYFEAGDRGEGGSGAKRGGGKGGIHPFYWL